MHSAFVQHHVAKSLVEIMPLQCIAKVAAVEIEKNDVNGLAAGVAMQLVN